MSGDRVERAVVLANAHMANILALSLMRCTPALILWSAMRRRHSLNHHTAPADTVRRMQDAIDGFCAE